VVKLAERKRTIAVVPVALLLLASCGGEGSRSSIATVGARGATGTSSITARPGAPTAPKGTRAGRRTRSKKGTQPAPERHRKKHRAHRGARGGKGGKATPPAASRNDKPQEVLARKAKRVCETLGLDALAQKYQVDASSEAVATAYANSYPPTFRTAVHDGCKSAFAGQ
jgi:hypothetical protein